MGKRHALMLAALVAAGCQSQGPVGSLPPSFNGPALADRPTPAAPVLPPPPVAQPVVPALPPPVASSDTPREWVPYARPNAWRWIVIHHSATPTGGVVAFDRMHKAKGWDEVGYHFVIGNGTDTRDGQIEVGSRWPKQKWGAHTKTPDNQYNDYGIGICLVGNFDVTRPSPAQIRSLTKLVAYLSQTYHISPDHVIGHGMAKPTECPGRNLSIADVRRQTIQTLAANGQTIPASVSVAPVTTASLLHDAN